MYYDGPRMREFFNETNDKFSKYNDFVVGELSFTPKVDDQLKYISAKERAEQGPPLRGSELWTANTSCTVQRRAFHDRRTATATLKVTEYYRWNRCLDDRTSGES
jgi:hypothetical protein